MHCRSLACTLLVVPFLGGPAFLVADDHGLEWPDSAKSGENAPIISKVTIAMQFAEVAADHVDVIGGLRPIGMSCDPHDVPGAQ